MKKDEKTGQLHQNFRPLMLEWVKRNWCSLLIWSLFIMVSVHALVFTYKIGNPYVQRDDWRFINLYLKPYYEGSLTIKQLWADHHPQPLNVLRIVWGARYFGLNMNHHAMLGMCFYIAFSWLLLSQFRKSFLSRSMPNFLSVSLRICGYSLVVIFLLFSLSQTCLYDWPLVTFNSGIIFLLAVFTMVSINSLIACKKTFYRSILTVLLVLFLLITYNDWSIIFIASVLLVLFGAFIIERKVSYLLATGVVVLSGGIGKTLLYFLMSREGQGERHLVSEVFNFLGMPLKYFKAIGISLASTVSNPTRFEHVGLSGNLVDLLALGSFLLFLIVYIAAWRYRIYRKTIFPLVLMNLFLVFMAAVFINRYSPSEHPFMYFTVPRYAPIYVVGSIGMFWSIFLLIEEAVFFVNSQCRKNQKKQHGLCMNEAVCEVESTCYFKELYFRFKQTLSLAVLLLVLSFGCIWFVNAKWAWERANYLYTVYYTNLVHQLQDINKDTAQEIVEKIPFWIRGYNDIRESVSFLSENQLNYYNPDFQARYSNCHISSDASKK